MLLALLAQIGREMAPAGGPPITWTGWGTLILSLLTAVFLLYDRILGKGKAETKLAEKVEKLCEKIEDLEGDFKVVDGLVTTVRELVFEWRGIAGNNGYKSLIKEIDDKVDAIQRRNDRIDAIREEDERRSGGMHRRRHDSEGT